MNISKNFIMKEIAGNYIVIPYGDNHVNLNSMITLNETGAFLWHLLEPESSTDLLEKEHNSDQLEPESTTYLLAKALVREYDVDPYTAMNDTVDFISKLQAAHILD